jgi:splicing factor 1
VDKAIKADPNFKPPAEYTFHKRNNRPQEKVYIPAKEFPEINFFGLLVGPRGNSLKGMENASGAKISIRGKGSVKPGKERNDQFASDEHDELHCLVMGDTQEKVDKCVKLINTVIETVSRRCSDSVMCDTDMYMFLNPRFCRPPRPQKARTTTSETSCENSPR